MTQPIQWYPGHIAKLERELKNILAKLDVVVEVIDARIPYASQHPTLSKELQAKGTTLLIMGKADLADPNQTRQWQKYYEASYSRVMAFNSLQGGGKKQVVDNLLQLAEKKLQSLEKKGLRRRPVRTGIVGLPNVGKSTLINSLVGAKKVKTGHRAGVTRDVQWVNIHPQVQLLDMPGIIPPRLESQDAAYLLACAYSIGDAAFDEEDVARFFLDRVKWYYPGLLNKHYGVSAETPLDLEMIAHCRGCLQSGGEPDLKRTAQGILKDFRLGRYGGLTLERTDTEREMSKAPETLE